MNSMTILLKAQQGELNAAVLYKALSDRIKDEKDKAMLLSIAADEGRHASIVRKLTGKKMRPRTALKNLTLLFYRSFGKKATYRIMAKTENAASKLYRTLLKEYPQLSKIADDEEKHGKMLIRAIQ